MRRALALCLVLALSACAGGTRPSTPPPAPPSPEGVTPPPAPPTPPAAPPPGVAPSATASLTGTVTYRQRVALTPEAVVQVELRDVSRADAEAPLVARQIIEKPGQVPIPFELPYDPAAIDPSHTYAVSARITDRGQLQFVTDTRVAVLGAGAPAEVEIVVVPLK